MEIRVLTLFPDLMDAVVLSSITGRAVNEGLIGYRAVDIRDYAGNKYGKVDDSVYGGGKGMLMMCGPVYDSWLSAKSSFDSESDPITIYMSPKGKVFDQKKAIELSQKENIIFLCGHYEGIDQRVLDVIVDEEISIGDYVLTGGEIAACAVIDATARLVPGVLPGEEAYSDES
ncbi:MAG: tRNA (guanosine(37)-N1)-methyltransferase TrmD, partial [Saccharofermentanales bacterium]